MRVRICVKKNEIQYVIRNKHDKSVQQINIKKE